jgi:predicted nicotinamide N-methyase
LGTLWWTHIPSSEVTITISDPSQGSVRIRYQTIEFGKLDIHLRTLRDKQQYSDEEGRAEALGISSATWSLFGVVWPSSEMLAHFMLNYDVSGKRVLEVGCGIALSSLLLNKLHHNITATDYHPEAGGFLKQNTALNMDADIPFVRTDWTEDNEVLGRFDIIIGSDVLYEQEHIAPLVNFINRHANPGCAVIIVDPRRGQVGRFSKRMTSLGYHHDEDGSTEDNSSQPPFKGRVLQFTKQ